MTQQDPTALIRGGRLRTDEFRVCLDGEALGDYGRLSRARQENPSPELDADLAEVGDRVREATVVLTFTALPHRRFRDIVDKHPPRQVGDRTHPHDVLGMNYEPFFAELLRVSLVDPQLDDDTMTVLLDEKLTDRQHDDLTDLVWSLNRKKPVAYPNSE
jgi:hypothetical protein